MAQETERTTGEIQTLIFMAKKWVSMGRPECAERIRTGIANGTVIDRKYLLVSAIDPVNAESMADLVPPPRSGRGSGSDEWRDYAFAMTDIDEEVVNNMSRDDIIAFLEDESIIEREDKK